VFGNPAGMTSLESSQLLLGTQLVVGDVHFDRGSKTTVGGGNGGNASGLVPGGSFFYAQNVTPDVRLGFWSVGGGFDSSPMSKGERSPNLPLDEQFRISTGLQYSFNPMTIGVAYEYMNAGDADLDVERGPLAGRLEGDYKSNDFHFFSINLSWRFQAPATRETVHARSCQADLEHRGARRAGPARGLHLDAEPDGHDRR